jgi:hypothetical protein
MTQRSKNLLEAFNATRAAEKAPAPPPAARSVPPKVGGPFAEAPARPAPPPPAPALPIPSGRARELAQWRQVAIYVVGALGAFILGRLSVGSSAEASESDSPPVNAAVNAPQAPTAQPSTPAASADGTEAAQLAADKALSDARNKYAILAAQYAESASEIARAASRYLAQQGLPACHVYRRGKNLYLIVGAAQNLVELDVLLARLRELPGPNGQAGDFKSAFVVPIDQYVER